MFNRLLGRWVLLGLLLAVSACQSDAGDTITDPPDPPVTGSLAVTVTGLPAGTNAAIAITGPNGFSRALTASETIAGLSLGTYTVTASEVTTTDFRYAGAPLTQSVTVAAGTTPAAVSVMYAATTGRLNVTIAGLPAGANAAVSVTGPGGFNRALTVTTTISQLVPGTYNVAASPVTAGATYTATPPAQNVAVSAAATATSTVTYAAPPLRLSLAQVASGLSRPVFLSAPTGDARLFIGEQTGRIRIVQNGQLLAQAFLDVSNLISAPIDTGDEIGLLGMAFHPQYTQNGFFFIAYTAVGGAVTVARYQAAGGANVANPAGAVVLSIPHSSTPYHNGGGLAFGPDGFLYISVGDGGQTGDPTGNAQSTATLLGKLLRIDVSALPYTVPASNPFVGQAGRRGEIWAYGLRNPWRFEFDVNTGRLFIADVGEDTMEEINAVSTTLAGANYGWNLTEGTRCVIPGCSTAGITMPVLEYTHGEGCSVIGGYAYRGSAIPELAGHYFYSDYCSGWLRSFLFANNTATERRDWGVPSVGLITSFGRDGAGELYMLNQGGNVYRMVRQ
ncbi:MAG: PQQ-dependent sugar dehydrogenase [Longimicrobiales bacterium]